MTSNATPYRIALSALLGIGLLGTHQQVAHAEDAEIAAFADYCKGADDHQYHAQIKDGQVFVLPDGTKATQLDVRESRAAETKGYHLCFLVAPLNEGKAPQVQRRVNLLIGAKKVTVVFMEKPKNVRK